MATFGPPRRPMMAQTPKKKKLNWLNIGQYCLTMLIIGIVWKGVCTVFQVPTWVGVIGLWIISSIAAFESSIKYPFSSN